jgi:enterochelin esterase-like enzyme
VALKRPKGASGSVTTLEFDSKILADNPLGDPHLRKFDVWLPPQYDQAHGRGRGKRFPVLFDLAGFTGSGKSRTNWRAFDENVPERAARLVHEQKLNPCILVFPDCFTALGGNQYVNSSAVGSYADYLTRELIPFIDNQLRTLPERNHRGCYGKSSGGYGALIHGMKYSRFWGAIGCHSGDAYFDFIYRMDWPNTLDELAKYRESRLREGKTDVATLVGSAERGIDDGRVRRFLERAFKRVNLSGNEVHCLMNLAMAASYDPDPSAANGFRLPFTLDTGELIPERWQQWLKADPINLVARHAKHLKTLKAVYIDCGWRDQYRLHYGSRILSQRLSAHGVAHRYEEFDGTHSGIDHRLDVSLPYLGRSLR